MWRRSRAICSTVNPSNALIFELLCLGAACTAPAPPALPFPSTHALKALIQDPAWAHCRVTSRAVRWLWGCGVPMGPASGNEACDAAWRKEVWLLPERRKKEKTGLVFQEAEVQNRFWCSCRCRSGGTFACTLMWGWWHCCVHGVVPLCDCFANVFCSVCNPENCRRQTW